MREIGHRWAMGAHQRRRGALRDRGRPVDPRRPRPQAAPAAEGRAAGDRLRDARRAARARHADGGGLPRGRRLGGDPARRRRARGTTSRRSSSPSSPTSWRSRPRRRACSTASSRCWARCARSSRARGSSPAASSGRRETSPTALEFGADLVVQDPRELVALLHERIPPLEAGRMRIREGGPADAATVLALFDDAVGVACRARADRASGAPSRSRRSTRASRPRPKWAASGGCGSPTPATRRVGALVLGARPAWVSPAPNARALHRRRSSRLTPARGRGHRRRAGAARDQRDATAGAHLLRVDCWAGAPPLVAWYERQGFKRAAAPSTVRGWHGQVPLDGARPIGPGRRGGAATAARCGSPGTSWRSPCVMPVRPATRPSSWLSSGSGPGVGFGLSMRPP